MHPLACSPCAQPNRCFWVAELGGEVVGVTALHIGPDNCPCSPAQKAGLTAKHGMVFRMSTHAGYRRRGIGRRLMVGAMNARTGHVGAHRPSMQQPRDTYGTPPRAHTGHTLHAAPVCSCAERAATTPGSYRRGLMPTSTRELAVS